MGNCVRRLAVMAAVLAASTAFADSAKAWNCYADPLRHLNAGEVRSINVKVKKDAICSYKFFTTRGSMHGVQILQKPASARVIANGYSVAYSFTQVGSYTMKININFAKGPVTIVMAVQVLPTSF
jgi:hypothetical protein